jgi:DNA-binding MarR family transcriptional regulator
LHDPLSDLPGYALRRAANAMMGELAARLETIDLRLSDATVLLVVGTRADLTSSDIGRMLDIQRANMVPLLHRLEDAKLIARQPIDGKSFGLDLTAPGRKQLAEARAVVETFEAELIARVPEAHRPHLLPALEALWR